MTSKRDIFVKTIATRRSVYSQDRLEQILSESIQAKEKEPGDRTAKDYRRIKRFDIVDVQGKQRLVAARTDNEEKDIRFFVSIEEMYDIIDYTHKKMNHGGRDRLWPILSKQYANIPREVIQTYLKMCDYCCKRRKRINTDSTNDNANLSVHNDTNELMDTSLTNIIHDIQPLQPTNIIKHEQHLQQQQQQQQHIVTQSAPIVIHNNINTSLHQQLPVENIFDAGNSHVMNRLCEYDLIDLQNAHDGDYGYVLVYQDYLTKFTQLRPLKTKSPIELGTTLMDIFCIFGPPLVLQSSADLHIENSAIQQTLEAVWPGIRLYQDDSSQWRETAKLRNEQIRSMIAAWMFVNNNPRWSYGLKFVQLTLNSNINNELKRSPYEALFKMLPVLRPATVTLSSTTTDMSLQPQQQQHIQQQHHHHSQLLQPTAAVVPPSSHSPSGSANEGDFVTPNVNILPSTISTSDRIKAEM
ncbi:unnamed protein product [Rotaria socialis]|uniref:Integrase zinc-binding domain-containing protein n=2 Tax=Rotaria socialis TaxID=392032 RepID=A0A821LDN8_9BILA|nr:unnamed protein product [Rotaria socialis]CAF3186929.1 unnamed protein product [Rotaria socialis]CAF3301875.1 unnamed protein product [Rotaria socialis]CAF3570607.1 unnamed protein product [Rotaria socialis]CAF3677682.1 unnamed protein product [Rotaria socialis]